MTLFVQIHANMCSKIVILNHHHGDREKNLFPKYLIPIPILYILIEQSL